MLGSLLLLQQLICVRPLTTICGIILYLHFSTTRHILCLKFKVLGIDGKFPNLLKRFGNLNKASIERPLKSTMNCWWGVLTNRYANFFNLSDTKQMHLKTIFSWTETRHFLFMFVKITITWKLYLGNVKSNSWIVFYIA